MKNRSKRHEKNMDSNSKIDTIREIICPCCGKLISINVTKDQWYGVCNRCKKTFYLDELDKKEWNKDIFIKTGGLA